MNFADPFGLCKESSDGEVTDCEKFARYVEQLAQNTSSDEEFIQRLSEEIAGLPNGPEGDVALPPVVFGNSGFDPRLVDDPNPARHYTAYVVASFEKGGLYGSIAAVAREAPGICQGGCSIEDVRLGLIGADHGSNLKLRGFTRNDLARWIRESL